MNFGAIRRRLMPNSSRVHLEKFNLDFARGVPDGALVLDAGAGSRQYRDLFYHARYESADFGGLIGNPQDNITYVCDLAAIPVESGRFDFILFNQTLEHIPDPLSVLRELHRVLKIGGRILCSAPLFYEEHMQPYDFFRYTQFGFRHLFVKAGFTVERVDWMEGYFGTVAYQLETAAKYLPDKPRDLIRGWKGYLLSPVLWSLKIVFVLIAALFYRLDRRAPYKDSGYPKNYVVLAVKNAI